MYLATGDGGFRKLNHSEIEWFKTHAPQPGETWSFVGFPFFKYEEMSQPDLAAQLIFEIDLLVAAAADSEDSWSMVQRALRFAIAYHRFVFDTSGANRLASIEHWRSFNQRSSLKKLTLRRRAGALALRKRVVEKAEAIWAKNPLLSRSAIADRIANEVGRSTGHVRRILKSLA